ncbi:MAG: hypothetical protein CR971_02670 [candidate division SR1 bacterium]|nr:MAG: hypothetical protein CR971_02670 [candidate division SR1 bacterium]
MFINISTDQVHLALNDEQYFFNRDDVEKTFGPKLIELAKKYNFSDVTVLNGPGGFTNLRVGALCLNMLNTLFEERFNFYDIDKITLYKHLVDQGILPNKGVIYIGQRKNIWDYDFAKDEYTQTQKTKLFKEKIKEDYFFDLVYDEEYFGKKMLAITGNGKQIAITTAEGKVINLDIAKDCNIKPEKYIKANYFIQPILGKQGQ